MFAAEPNDVPVAAETESSLIEKKVREMRLSLWSTPNNRTFYPVASTQDTLPPDLYDIGVANGQIMFSRMNYSTDELIRFEESQIEKVLNEIDAFWGREDMFKEFGMAHRRGVLLYGPPGSGKSCTIKLIVNDVIDRGGIAINFRDPTSFTLGMRVFREIQPDTPVVAIMEDVEVIARHGSDVLNILDGLERFEKIVFLATTNYPEELEPRIKNRPSRFDRRYKIDHPGDKSRRMYIEFLQAKSDKIEKIDVDRWVKDTSGMSIAHIKELFISTRLFSYDYDDALKELRSMENNISSEQFGRKIRKTGFVRPVYEADGMDCEAGTGMF
jgi:SpoVK/Ycf46/Vps4 family AAA+-type ATPase